MYSYYISSLCRKNINQDDLKMFAKYWFLDLPYVYLNLPEMTDSSLHIEWWLTDWPRAPEASWWGQDAPIEAKIAGIVIRNIEHILAVDV